MADGASGSGFAERLGAEVTLADDGSARMLFTAREEHLNQAGTLHGGVLATLVDTAMGAAIRSTTDDGDVPATSHLTVTYLRPGEPGPRAVTARVRTRGEHLTICEADVEQDDRRWRTPSRRSRCCTPDTRAAPRARHPTGWRRAPLPPGTGPAAARPTSPGQPLLLWANPQVEGAFRTRDRAASTARQVDASTCRPPGRSRGRHVGAGAAE